MFVFNVTTFEVLWATTFKRQFIFLEKLFFKEEVLCDISWSFSAINCYQNELHLRSGVVTGSSSDCEWISPYNFVKDLCLCLYYHVKLYIWFVWIYTIHLCFWQQAKLCYKVRWVLPGVKSCQILNGRLLIKFSLKGVLGEGLPSERCIKFIPRKIMLFWDYCLSLCKTALLYSVLSIYYLKITFLLSCLAWRRKRGGSCFKDSSNRGTRGITFISSLFILLPLFCYHSLLKVFHHF